MTIEKQEIKTDIPVTPVQVHAQYVKDFSFENPNAPASFRPSNARPELDVNIMIDAVKIEEDGNPHLYETTLTLTIKSMREGKALFISEILYSALVSLKEMPGEHIRAILYVEVPQMLFPFARQIVANAVTNGGFPPLLLNPVDFRGMYQSTANNKIAATA